MLKYFPTQSNLHFIEQSINLFLIKQQGKYRDKMLINVRSVLDKYGVSKIDFATYSVHRTIDPDFSAIQAKSHITSRTCPGCGSDIYSLESPVRILSVEEGINDKVTYGCRCGQIFYKVEKKV